MRYLIILLFVISCSSPIQAQNKIQNLTDNNTVNSLVKYGLNELEINDIHITILPLSNYYKKIKAMAGSKPWGVTMSGNKHTYTIIISLRHESDIGISFKERVAHELIHVYQSYYSIDCVENCEKQAYNKQSELANQITDRIL
jgi:hypothetical protein